MEYLTLQQAAERLPGKPHPRTVLDRVKRGKIKAVHDGDRYYTTQEWLDEFLQEQTKKRIPTFFPFVPVQHASVEALRAKYRRRPRSSS